MKSFYINPATGDIELDGQNNIRMVEGDAELAQCVSITLKTNKGEWFINPDHGFDRSIVQVKNYDPVEAQDALYEAVLQEDRVATIEDVVMDYDKANRHLKVDFKFRKENGELVEGVVG